MLATDRAEGTIGHARQEPLQFGRIAVASRVRALIFQAYEGTLYHLYYGNGVGSPGTVMTFFPWPGVRRGVIEASLWTPEVTLDPARCGLADETDVTVAVAWLGVLPVVLIVAFSAVIPLMTVVNY